MNGNRTWELRLLGIGIGTIGILSCFFYLLFSIQVEFGGAAAAETVSQVEIVPAARGEIRDRNGTVLVGSRTSYQITAEPKGGGYSRFQELCSQLEVAWKTGGDGTLTVENAPQELILAVEEEKLAGVTVSPVEARVYETDCAAHLLGRVGPIYSENWGTYQAMGYQLSDRVGVDGVEKAFEEELHGSAGLLRTEAGEEGTAEHWERQPQPGNSLELTLDLSLQEAVEERLAAFVPTLEGARGAACVVMAVNSGEILASASYPTYSLSTFGADYSDLAADSMSPMFNRAFLGTYPPGSTFKMVTAAAGLEEGIITPATKIQDTGIYTFYEDYQPKCWLYRQSGRTHGKETVSQAIRDSCNVFFYEVGRQVGIDTLDRYARAFGLGEETGVELPASVGTLAGPEQAQAAGENWYAGNTLAAAIGQSGNLFTPLQLACYTAALANGGTRYQAHLLRRVVDYRGNIVEETEPKVLSQVELGEENLAAIQEGMRLVATEGSVAKYFVDCPVTLGAKTGSAQVTGQENSNAVFVCFAPFEEPEVAIAIVVENGGGGAELGKLAAELLGEIFS